jgi:hypothetical protein
MRAMAKSSTGMPSPPCAPCGAHGFYVLSPLRIIAYGRNGVYAQRFSACASVPESGWITVPTEDDVLQAPLSLRVCVACGASQFFTDPALVRAMVDAEQPGVAFVPPEAAAPYR